MKTLCQAEHYVAIEHNQTCASVEWIAQQQNTDGSFKEKAWVTHREMLGGINGDVSHAAYILIALMECDCPGKVQKEVIVKTMRFIQTRVALTDRPLALATSAYALTLAGSRISEVVVKRLMMLAKSSPEGFTYWAPGTDEDFKDHDKPYWFAKKPGALAVEVTSYALLTLLVRGDIKTGTSIVGWLTQQRNSHGAFISTQDTVVGLQALSEYSIKSYSAILDMTCHISSEVDDRFRKSISLTPEDAMVLKSVPKVPTGGKLHFEAEGTGVGLMQVEVRFNVPNDLDQCRFDVKVNTHRPNTLIQSFFGESRSKCEPCDLECEEDDYDDIDGDEGDDDDFENFTFPPIVPRIQTLWYKRKSGAGSATPRPSKKQGPGVEDNMSSAQTPRIPFGSKMGRPRSRRSVKPYSDVVVCIQVCARFLGVKTTGMSVMDVGLFTGFVPIEEDLKALKEKGSIDHYEKSKRSVVLYIDEISNTQSSCVRFRARQEHMAENIQPAKVQVFDYYNPDDRCTVFYKSDNRSGQLANFCDKQKQICQCLESRCAYCEESWSGLRWMDMMRFACKNATYVLEIKALDRDLEKAGFERILGQISDTSVQRGPHKLQVGDKVILLKRASCFCPRVSPGKSYLMMLDAPKRFRDSDGNQIYAFLLDKTIFALENFKVKQKGLTSAQRSTAKSVRRTVRRLKRRGCSRVKHRKKNRRGKGRGKKSERANTRRS
ncbi:complement C3 [Aplysia californica]|uniref:Complement C3 n=1 Tax=Aplysia californica TaxID=6500 RepID=A0ABM0K7F6_APLCA|nr:complement C3 [Aplysia californica]